MQSSRQRRTFRRLEVTRPYLVVTASRENGPDVFDDSITNADELVPTIYEDVLLGAQ